MPNFFCCNIDDRRTHLMKQTCARLIDKRATSLKWIYTFQELTQFVQTASYDLLEDVVRNENDDIDDPKFADIVLTTEGFVRWVDARERGQALSLDDPITNFLYAAYAVDFIWKHVDYWFEVHMDAVRGQFEDEDYENEHFKDYETAMEKMEELNEALQHAVCDFNASTVSDLHEAIMSGDPNLVFDALIDGTSQLDIGPPDASICSLGL